MKCEECGTEMKRILDHLYKCPRCGAENNVSPDFDETDLSFTAHDDAVSGGCQMCGNEWKSLNKQGYCSNCWAIWNS